MQLVSKFIPQKFKNNIWNIRDENLILKCCKNKNLIINLALISIPYSYQAINSNIETNILSKQYM